MLWSSLRFLGQTFSLYSDHLYNATNHHLNDVPGFLLFEYNNHCTKVFIIYMLFHHSIIFCLEWKYLFLSVSCVIKWKIMLPLLYIYINTLHLYWALFMYCRNKLLIFIYWRKFYVYLLFLLYFIVFVRKLVLNSWMKKVQAKIKQ